MPITDKTIRYLITASCLTATVYECVGSLSYIYLHIDIQRKLALMITSDNDTFAVDAH